LRTSSDFAEDVAGEVVKGWAEIAAALGCGVRTAQRWEKAGRISIYRSAGSIMPRIFARRAEIGIWSEGQFPLVCGPGGWI